ncbi:TPA: hypothetical protein RG734_002060 [Providencia stuartii]|nr:hypothetical protein [Providencia stuartii]
MHNLMLPPPVESKNSDLHKTASLAQRYARELTIEIKPLLNRLSTSFPKEAGRLIGLLSELDLMTSVTLSRVEKLMNTD